MTLALRFSPDVIGVYLSKLEGPDAQDHHRELHDSWVRDVVAPARAPGRPEPRLLIVGAQHLTIHEPLLRLIDELRAKFGERPVARCSSPRSSRRTGCNTCCTRTELAACVRSCCVTGGAI